VKADEFLKFYEEKRRWARTFMLIPERTPSSHSFGGGNGRLMRHSSFKGMFDVERWATYCGLTVKEYDSLEHRLREWRKGHPTYLSDRIVETVLTNLGRPDLYAVWFLDDEESLDAA
jgi:hypothetical protein